MTTQEVTHKIKLMLSLNDEAYNMLMFETGEEFFEFKCAGFTQVLEIFRKSKSMWNWWNQQYLIIDEAIAANGRTMKLEEYRATHLGLEYYPDEAIVKKAITEYEQITQSLIKTTIKNEKERKSKPGRTGSQNQPEQSHKGIKEAETAA